MIERPNKKKTRENNVWKTRCWWKGTVCVNISFTHLWNIKYMHQQTKYIISKIMCAEGDWTAVKDCEILTPFPRLAIKIPCITCICLTQIHSFIHCWNTMYYKVDQFPVWLCSHWNRSPVDLKFEILTALCWNLSASSVVLMDPKPLHIQYNKHAVTWISHFLFRYY